MIIIIMITIRPGPNMDANPAGLGLPSFSIILFSRHLRFRRRNLLCADQPNWLEISLESLFFCLHLGVSHYILILIIPLFTAPRYLREAPHWILASRTQRRIQVIQPLRL
jgi:hypothetical protein